MEIGGLHELKSIFNQSIFVVHLAGLKYAMLNH